MAKRPAACPIPVVQGYPDLRRLPGGHTHETYLGTHDGEDVVVRVYGSGTRRRGPEAPGVQAGVHRLAAGILPVPRLIEWRPGVHGLLVTSRLPGVPLHGVLEYADADLQHRLGTSMGEVLGRMANMAMTGPGCLKNEKLLLGPWEAHSESLVTWLAHHTPGSALEQLGTEVLDGLRVLAEQGDELLAISPRAVLVHGDLSPRNVLCDPTSGQITGLIDWEFARSGHPVEDAGKMIRRHGALPFADHMLMAMNPWLPTREQASLPELMARARAADFYWLIEVGSRRGGSPATNRAWKLLRKMGAQRTLLPDRT
ncbi:MAG: phosphotransferase [Marmoricola sp.]